MFDTKNIKNTKMFMFKKCNFNCRKKSDYDRHLLTAKHNMLDNAVMKHAENTTLYVCIFKKEYKHNLSFYRHKKTCSLIQNYIVIIENPEEKPNMMDIITQNKEMVLQHKE